MHIVISMYKIKPKFQQLVKPLLHIFYKVGFTANGITWLSILLSTTIGVLFWFYPNSHMLWIFSVGLLIRMGLNALDGMMAKTYNMTSQGGEMLNELGDVVSDAVLYLPLIKLSGVYPWLVLLFIFLSTINEFIGVLTKAATGTRRYDGPMGKSDRATFLGLSCLIFFFWQPMIAAFNYIFVIMCILLLLSSAFRIKNGLSEVGSQ